MQFISSFGRRAGELAAPRAFPPRVQVARAAAGLTGVQNQGAWGSRHWYLHMLKALVAMKQLFVSSFSHVTW